MKLLVFIRGTLDFLQRRNIVAKTILRIFMFSLDVKLSHFPKLKLYQQHLLLRFAAPLPEKLKGEKENNGGDGYSALFLMKEGCWT